MEFSFLQSLKTRNDLHVSHISVNLVYSQIVMLH
jgi:hypothetical protein